MELRLSLGTSEGELSVEDLVVRGDKAVPNNLRVCRSVIAMCNPSQLGGRGPLKGPRNYQTIFEPLRGRTFPSKLIWISVHSVDFVPDHSDASIATNTTNAIVASALG